jgi:hypothetical protein
VRPASLPVAVGAAADEANWDSCATFDRYEENVSMHAVKWIVGALAVLALMGVGIMVGMELLPPGAEAMTKGTLVPWLFTWGMIWATTAMGIVIAVYMVGIGLRKVDA